MAAGVGVAVGVGVAAGVGVAIGVGAAVGCCALPKFADPTTRKSANKMAAVFMARNSFETRDIGQA